VFFGIVVLKLYMQNRQMETTSNSAENLAKDYLSCSLYPQIPLNPTPINYVSTKDRVIDITPTITSK
jgi:hypothetical protein